MKLDQRIVFQVQMNCEKSRKIARTVVAKTDGVNSLAMVGEDRVVVVGYGVDIACLKNKLHKKVLHHQRSSPHLPFF
ncbi:hypothetical protein Tsubulata_001674 [Turnera subulata]|uniref:HMA domain-containing protein n=1 Tax=Turnera subulata TaxID=218843 RepID=A0A9Q0FUM1_9ROSI|nr:hypothetical protein Tsubulata_001674 [Turnera subulata]